MAKPSRRSRPAGLTAFVAALGVACVLVLGGCPPPGLGSRIYQPLDWEHPLLERATKTVMPSDVAADPAAYEGQLIHWVGLVDSVAVAARGDSVLAEVRFTQHYYDYVEDFGGQRETMFVSPLGSGRFVYSRVFTGVPADSVAAFQRELVALAAPGNLGMVYGTVDGSLRDGLPHLSEGVARFVAARYVTTRTFSYDVERDAEGRVVGAPTDFPRVASLRFLR